MIICQICSVLPIEHGIAQMCFSLRHLVTTYRAKCNLYESGSNAGQLVGVNTLKHGAFEKRFSQAI